MVTTKSRTPKSGPPKSTAKPRATKVRSAAAKPRTATLRKGTSAATKAGRTKAGSSRAVVAEAAVEMVIAGASPVATKAPVTAADLPQTAPDGAEDAPYKKKHLIERVVAISGVKKRIAKDVVEATLAALGDALIEGRSVNLPPLGKLTVNRQKDLASGEVLIVKLRRGGAAGKAGADPLADNGEAG